MDELVKGRWMSGPPFLKKPIDGEPQDEDLERRRTPFPSISAVVQIKPLLDPTTHSRWGRLVKVTAYCMRFGSNLKSSVRNRADSIDGPLRSAEIEAAEEYWIR